MISSWQFFKEVTPKLEIEFSWNDDARNWQVLKLRAQNLSTIELIKSVFFNPQWNEALYIMDCAERLIMNPSQERINQLKERIQMQLEKQGFDLSQKTELDFKVIVDGETLFNSQGDCAS